MIDKIQFFIFIILLFHLVLLSENFEDVYSKRFENRKQRIHQKPTYYDKLEIPDVEKEKAAAIKYIRECHEGIIFPKVEKPMFTVIIPYRNIGSKIRPALISLERQDLRDFEIILVDDGYIKDPIEPVINDILRIESITPTIDLIASIFQIIMIICFCFSKDKNNKIGISSLVSLILYFVCWVFYYFGIVNDMVIIGLCLFPCLSFLIYGVKIKNWIAIIPTIIFTILHLIYGIINFI